MMRPALQLDFVAPRRQRRWPGILVLVVALGLAGELVLKYREAQQRLQRLDASQSLLNAARPAKAARGERLEEQVKAAHATVRQLALPWPQLVDSLERAAMKDVAVLHIQPDAQSRVMRVTAETRREELMMEYLRRLGRSFSEVHLLSHQVREDDPARPIQFSLQASFRDSQ